MDANKTTNLKIRIFVYIYTRKTNRRNGKRITSHLLNWYLLRCAVVVCATLCERAKKIICIYDFSARLEIYRVTLVDCACVFINHLPILESTRTATKYHIKKNFHLSSDNSDLVRV